MLLFFEPLPVTGSMSLLNDSVLIEFNKEEIARRQEQSRLPLNRLSHREQE